MTGLHGLIAWLERVDPGCQRRVKGLRLVTAYALAALMGSAQGVALGLAGRASLGSFAAGLALWASVSEARTTRFESARDLAVLVLAGVVGAVSMIALGGPLTTAGRAGPELALVIGAFLVGYLRRYGLLGAGIGSQVFIGQLLAFGFRATVVDLPTVAVAGVIAAVAAIVPRLLSGPAEHPTVPSPLASIEPAGMGLHRPELRMGVQAAVAALLIVLVNEAISLDQSAWAITACTYVIAATASATVSRVLRRIAGTAVGVPLGLACLPFAPELPALVWAAAAAAMIVYAVALPDRYDVACGAYAFALVVTLAAAGEGSLPLLLARAWETVIGGVLGLAAATFILPLREPG